MPISTPSDIVLITTIDIFGISISTDVNLTGSTSISITTTDQIDDNKTMTKGFTLGINTGVLGTTVVAGYGVYHFVTTGDTSVITYAWESFKKLFPAF